MSVIICYRDQAFFLRIYPSHCSCGSGGSCITKSSEVTFPHNNFLAKRKYLMAIPGGSRFPCGNKNGGNQRLGIEKNFPLCGSRTDVGNLFELNDWTPSFSLMLSFTPSPHLDLSDLV